MQFTRNYTRYILAGLVLLSGLWGSAAPIAAEGLTQDVPTVFIYFFWGDGCPHCAEAKPFLQDLARRYPTVQVELFEVWYDADNQALFRSMAAAHGFEPSYVPTIFIGDRYWQGFADPLRAEMESAAHTCVEAGCPDTGAGIVPGHEVQATPVMLPTATAEAVCGIKVDDCDESTAIATPEPASASQTLQVPLLGTVDLKAHSLWVSTALISLVDGFNPCSLWVLSILIALTLRTGSRKKIFIIGLTFITVTALVYVLFIAGLFTMLTVVSFLGWIQAAVSLLALFFAVINIKDYFWYKEGLSFTIDEGKKPGLYKRMRQVLHAGDSLSALLVATVGLGLGVSLVEFSCTAGFPVLWTNLVAAQNVTPLTFALLLLLYMVIYQMEYHLNK